MKQLSLLAVVVFCIGMVEVAAGADKTEDMRLRCGVAIEYQKSVYLVTGVHSGYLRKLDLLDEASSDHRVCISIGQFRNILGEVYGTPCVLGIREQIIKAQFSHSASGRELKGNSIDITRTPQCEIPPHSDEDPSDQPTLDWTDLKKAG